MKINKLNRRKVATSKVARASNTANSNSFKHVFSVLSSEEINSKRSKAYQYLAL